MTPAEYVSEIVVPTVIEFRDDRRSRRRAYLSCIATFHIKDHLRRAGESGIEKKMRAATGIDFDVVRAICNGTKHVSTNNSHPYPFATGDDWDRPPGVFGEFQFGISQFGDTEGGREITAGSVRVDLYTTVTRVLSAFCDTFPAHFRACDVSGC